jgi:hypothetical protein
MPSGRSISTCVGANSFGGRTRAAANRPLGVLGGPPCPLKVRPEGRAIAGKVPDDVGIVFQEGASFWLSVTITPPSGRTGMAEAEIARVDHALSFMVCAVSLTPIAQLQAALQRLCIARTRSRPRHAARRAWRTDQQTRLLMGDELLVQRETGAVC